MPKIPDCPSDIQVIPVKINLKKQKLLVIATYTTPSQCKNYFIIELTKILDNYRGSYENSVILGDFFSFLKTAFTKLPPNKLQ